jgi:hypothetical protein
VTIDDDDTVRGCVLPVAMDSMSIAARSLVYGHLWFIILMMIAHAMV